MERARLQPSRANVMLSHDHTAASEASNRRGVDNIVEKSKSDALALAVTQDIIVGLEYVRVLNVSEPEQHRTRIQKKGTDS